MYSTIYSRVKSDKRYVFKSDVLKRQIGNFVGHPVDDPVRIIDNGRSDVGRDGHNFAIGMDCVLEV